MCKVLIEDIMVLDLVLCIGWETESWSCERTGRSSWKTGRRGRNQDCSGRAVHYIRDVFIFT